MKNHVKLSKLDMKRREFISTSTLGFGGLSLMPSFFLSQELKENDKLPGGLWPVMLTPFKNNGAIDFGALEELVEFYLENGAKGLFANCLSSEMYLLSREERIVLTQNVVRLVNNRVPVISTGTFGGPLASQAEFIKRIYDTQVKAVIIITSQLVEPGDDDEKLLENLMILTELTAPIPLGTYECPVPFKRLLTPEIVFELASTGRFFFTKTHRVKSITLPPNLK
jgi:4-hydroxy-tetrahydrodipicolinate synthase